MEDQIPNMKVEQSMALRERFRRSLILDMMVAGAFTLYLFLKTFGL